MDSLANHIYAIGGSAGAYELIVEILEHLPEEFQSAIIIVLHRNSKYETKIESSLSKRLKRNVVSIKDKYPVLANNIYFAPPGYHTLAEPGMQFSLDISEPVQFSRPSIDVFFESLAELYAKDTTAFLLSGANTDGAKGLKLLGEAGAVCYVQDPNEAIIDTMPKSGLSMTKHVKALSNEHIINFFRSIT